MALHLGFSDDDYKTLGAELLNNEKEIIKQSRYNYSIRIYRMMKNYLYLKKIKP